MRGLRSFIGLLIVLIALGAYLYFVESKRTPGDDAETRDKVFTVEAGQIEEISIKAESGDRTTLKKTGDRWQLTAPEAAEADASEVAGITRNLATLEVQRVIEETPASVDDFGLAKPRIEVAFRAAGQEHKLFVGIKTPTGGDLYARTGAQPRVFLIPSFVETTLNRGTFDLRDKTAVKFDRDQADSIEVVTAGQTMKFTKSGGGWQIAQPAVSRADTAAIESLVSRLDGLQMKKIAAANAADLKQYGLDSPAATVRIGTGSSQATLLVGGNAQEGDVFAKDASRPEIFTLEASLLDDLKKGPGDYRQKDIFDARAFNTTRVEVTRAGQTIVVEKAGDKWRLAGATPKDADMAQVDALLSSLTGARADSFLDAPPAAATEAAVVALKFDGGQKGERVTFMRSGADAFAVRADAPGAARIEASVLDGILKALDEIK